MKTEAIAEQASREQKRRLRWTEAQRNKAAMSLDGKDTCHDGIGSM
jgi:hypothetical protein